MQFRLFFYPMMKYAVIGAGVSGLSMAGMLLKKGHEVVVYERDSRPGGLIKCTEVQGNLYHRVGGHVFNSRRQEVLDWFWSRHVQIKKGRKNRNE